MLVDAYGAYRRITRQDLFCLVQFHLSAFTSLLRPHHQSDGCCFTFQAGAQFMSAQGSATVHKLHTSAIWAHIIKQMRFFYCNAELLFLLTFVLFYVLPGSMLQYNSKIALHFSSNHSFRFFRSNFPRGPRLRRRLRLLYYTDLDRPHCLEILRVCCTCNVGDRPDRPTTRGETKGLERVLQRKLERSIQVIA